MDANNNTKRKSRKPKSFTEFLYNTDSPDSELGDPSDVSEQIALGELFAEDDSPCTRCFIDEDFTDK